MDVLDDSDDEMLKEIEIDGVEVTPDTKHVTRAVCNFNFVAHPLPLRHPLSKRIVVSFKFNFSSP